MKRTLLLSIAAFSLVLAACSTAASPSPSPSPTPAPAGDIVEVATEAAAFTTLLKAAEVAGLVDTLKGEGPYTVFAPTDDAFAALPAGTLDSLLEDPEALKAILLYHVVEGAVTSDQVVDLTEATSIEGSTIKISVVDETVTLNDSAEVVTPDVMATNGVIHVISAVLLPPTD